MSDIGIRQDEQLTLAPELPASTRGPGGHHHSAAATSGSLALLAPEGEPTGSARLASARPRRGRQRPGLRARLFAVDLVGAALAWAGVSLAHPGGIGLGTRLAGAGGATAATLAVMAMAGLYRTRVCALKSSQGLGIVWACVTGAVAFVVVRRSIGAGGGLTEAVAAGAIGFVLLVGLRWHFDRWLRRCRTKGRFTRRVVLVGANADAQELWTIVTTEPELGYRIELVVAAEPDRGIWEDIPVVDGLDRVPDLARLAGANGLLIVPSALSRLEIQQILRAAMHAGLHVQLWPGLKGVGSGRLRSLPISREAAFYVEVPSSSRLDRVLKRAVDVTLSSLVLLAVSPVLLVAAALIKLQDGGPVLLRQSRVGRDGATFALFKLRTMVPGAEVLLAELSLLNERTDGPLFKVRSDPRVTPIGRLLRATSIDELPQLFNVLTGTMSLVGPRPALVDEVAQFDEESLRRLTVLPGITGLWQVEARDNPSFHAYRRFDLLYVDNWSIGLDISILIATGPVVIEHALKALAHWLTRRDKARPIR